MTRPPRRAPLLPGGRGPDETNPCMKHIRRLITGNNEKIRRTPASARLICQYERDDAWPDPGPGGGQGVALEHFTIGDHPRSHFGSSEC